MLAAGKTTYAQQKGKFRAGWRALSFVSLIAVFCLFAHAVPEEEKAIAGGRVLLSNTTWTPAANVLDDYPPMPWTVEELKDGPVILYVLGVLYMFIALGIIVDEFFVPCLDVLTEWLGLSQDVAGATLMAAGGSFPELCTSFIGAFTGSAVGFGTIVGSAVFNVLFVIAACVVFTPDVLALTWWPLARDATVYVITLINLAVFFGIITPNRIELWESFVLFAQYLIYLLIMKNNVQLHKYVLIKLGRIDELNQLEASEAAKQAVELISTEADQQDSKKMVKFRAGFLGMLARGLTTVDVAMLAMLEGSLEESFKRIDINDDGIISKEEAAKLISADSSDAKPGDLMAAINAIDTNQDGVISLDEFTKWYMGSQHRIEKELDYAFNSVNTSGDGKINKQELLVMLTAMSPTKSPPSDAEFKAVWDDLDENSDGQIDRGEFSKWYKSSIFYQEKKQAVEEETNASYLDPPPSLRGRIGWAITLPLSILFHLTLPDVQKKSQEKYAVWGFFMSMVWIGALSWMMVWWATVVGEVVGIPPAIMGLTFLAAGTSIPDLLSSVAVAQAGEGDMAVSSSIGSNIFDVTVGLPIPWMLYALIEGRDNVVDSGGNLLFINLLTLGLMVAAVVSIIAWQNWKMTNNLAASMFFLYFIFLVHSLLIEEGVIVY